MLTPESPQTHRRRRFRPGTNRFHTAKLPPSPSDEIIADTLSVDNSRVLDVLERQATSGQEVNLGLV
jgi:hypothetical protein